MSYDTLLHLSRGCQEDILLEPGIPDVGMDVRQIRWDSLMFVWLSGRQDGRDWLELPDVWMVVM